MICEFRSLLKSEESPVSNKSLTKIPSISSESHGGCVYLHRPLAMPAHDDPEATLLRVRQRICGRRRGRHLLHVPRALPVPVGLQCPTGLFANNTRISNAGSLSFRLQFRGWRVRCVGSDRTRRTSLAARSRADCLASAVAVKTLAGGALANAGAFTA